MLGVMKEMVKVNVCAVSETWLNEYDNDAMKAEAMDGWGLVGKDGKEEALVCWSDRTWNGKKSDLCFQRGMASHQGTRLCCRSLCPQLGPSATTPLSMWSAGNKSKDPQGKRQSVGPWGHECKSGRNAEPD